MEQKILYVSTCFFPKNLDKLKLKLQSKGFHVEEVLEMKKFLWYRKLTRSLQISKGNTAVHFYKTRGYLVSSDYANTDEDMKLLQAFRGEYNLIGFIGIIEKRLL
jgi:hypothetical protein